MDVFTGGSSVSPVGQPEPVSSHACGEISHHTSYQQLQITSSPYQKEFTSTFARLIEMLKVLIDRTNIVFMLCDHSMQNLCTYKTYKKTHLHGVICATQ